MTKIISNKSNVDLDYPVVRPSLDLDFTQEVLDPRITFSRGSIGTRVNRNRLIETVAANQPRFDYDPVTGECKGLLIEESRQNLLTYSDDFSNASWIKSGASIITSSIVSPSGSTSFKLVENTVGNVGHIISQANISKSSNAVLTLTIFAKAAERQYFGLVINSSSTGFVNRYGAEFNLGNGTARNNDPAQGTYSSGSFSIRPYPNGWYRCTITCTTATDAQSQVRIFTFRDVNQWTSAASYAGDGTSGIYIWGAQLEVGAFPTSYIPTTASTVTRSAELAEMTGTNFSSWYNQNEGTIYTDNRIPYTPNPNTSLYFLIFGINDGNRHSIEQTTANGIVCITRNSGGIQYWSTSGSGVLPANTNRKTTYSYSSSNNTTILSGTSNQTYNFGQRSSVDVYKSMTTLYIGRFSNSLFFLNGTIARFTYYPKKLKDNQLLYLTQ